MFRPRVIPVLLLKNFGLVKTIKFKYPKYVGDPINAIRIFNEKGADEIIFLDILATSENKRPQFDIIEKIATECFMPVCYGGGIRSIGVMRDVFNLGIEKVSINSYAVENPNFIKEAADEFGSQSIVVCIDVKKNKSGQYEVVIFNGKKRTGIKPVKHAIKMQDLGAGEILLNSVDRDGTMQGYDMELIKSVSESVNIPVIACGGAGNLGDLVLAIENGHAQAVAAGSIFVFYGSQRAVLINYPSQEELNECFYKKVLNYQDEH